MWEIRDLSGELIGRYVGKAEGGDERPMTHYKRNVDKLLKGLPYKKGKSYRRVHHALAEATRKEHLIYLSYLCNVSPNENIFQVEMRYIRELRCLDAAGFGLNGRGLVPLPDTSKEAYFKNEEVSSVVQKEETNSAPQQVEALDQLMELVQIRYRDVLELEPGKKRYAWYIGNKRIIRAEQSGPRAKVRIKLAVSSLLDRSTQEHPWDGTETQITEFIEKELHRYHGIMANFA
jgi:hypothetical protein